MRITEEGESLYIKAQSAQEKCISTVSAALNTFTTENANEAKSLRDKAITSGKAFMQWAEKHEKDAR